MPKKNEAQAFFENTVWHSKYEEARASAYGELCYNEGYKKGLMDAPDIFATAKELEALEAPIKQAQNLIREYLDTDMDELPTEAIDMFNKFHEILGDKWSDLDEEEVELCCNFCIHCEKRHIVDTLPPNFAPDVEYVCMVLGSLLPDPLSEHCAGIHFSLRKGESA